MANDQLIPAPKTTSQLTTSLKYLEKRFGKGVVMNLLGSVDTMPCIPSGHPFVDYVMGGGFYFGRHIELFGPESSGKSTLAYMVAIQAQRLKFNTGRVLILDHEHSWSKTYFKKLGGLIDPEHLLVAQPDTAEDSLEIMREFVDNELVDLIVVDSVSAMLPEAEEAVFLNSSGNEVESGSGRQRGTMGKAHIGSQSLMMSQALKQMSARIDKKRVCVIWINQIRTKINTTGGQTTETTSGGNALRFYATVRLEMRKIGAVKGKVFNRFENKTREGIVAMRSIVKGAKNKAAPPFREAPVTIRFGSGLDVEDSILEFASLHNIVTKTGQGWYLTEALGATRNARGLDDFRKLRKEEPKIWDVILSKCDFEKVMDGEGDEALLTKEPVPSDVAPQFGGVQEGDVVVPGSEEIDGLLDTVSEEAEKPSEPAKSAVKKPASATKIVAGI